MTHKEAEAQRERQDLAEFICGKVVVEFDLDDLHNLRKYIEDHDDDTPEAALCDYLELGNWFYDAMTDCDFDTERFVEELDQQIRAEDEETARDRAEIEDDYLRSVGAK